MEHAMYVTAHGHRVLPEPQHHSQEGGSQYWPWEQEFLKVVTSELKGTVVHHPVFPIMLNHVEWDVPADGSVFCSRLQLNNISCLL